MRRRTKGENDKAPLLQNHKKQSIGVFLKPTQVSHSFVCHSNEKKRKEKGIPSLDGSNEGRGRQKKKRGELQNGTTNSFFSIIISNVIIFDFDLFGRCVTLNRFGTC